MNTIIPIASGKGGVGKSIISANLGVALAKQGKTVVLVDLDLGASNLHTLLGIKNKHNGIGSFILKEAKHLEELIIPTTIPKLFFIPGDNLVPGSANIPYFIKTKIIKELSNVVADFIILDLGAGSSFNTIDFFLASFSGIVVTTPETTSILNAYSFIKTVVFRLLFRSFKRGSDEREAIKTYMTQKVEGNNAPFSTLLQELREINPESSNIANNNLIQFYPRIIMNVGRSQADLGLGSRLRSITRKNLNVEMEYIGFIPNDNNVLRSSFERTPTLINYPQSLFAQSMMNIGKTILQWNSAHPINLYDGDEDLDKLNKLIENMASE